VHDSYTKLEIAAQQPLETGEKKGKPNQAGAVIFPLVRSDMYDVLSTVDLDPVQMQYFVRDILADIENKKGVESGVLQEKKPTEWFFDGGIGMKMVHTKEFQWRGEEECVVSHATFTKTGELMNFEVWLNGPRQLELKGHEISTNEKFNLELDEKLLEDLDNEDPWNELFQMVGIAPGPPRVLVFPDLLGRKEVMVEPYEHEIILTMYRYDVGRYYCNGYDAETSRLADFVLNDENLTDKMVNKIRKLQNSQPEFVFDYLKSLLKLEEDEDSGELVFTVLTGAEKIKAPGEKGGILGGGS